MSFRSDLCVCFIITLISFNLQVLGEFSFPENNSFTRSGHVELSKLTQQLGNSDRIRFEDWRFDDEVRDSERGTIFTFDRYYRTTEIYQLMDYLHFKYQDLVEIFAIGNTWENRPIRTMKISSKNATNSAIWIDGGIHAREWISVSSVCFIVYHLLKNWNDLDPIFRNTDYYVTPILNPDGYEYSHGKHFRLWRKNRRKLDFCYGVDLNRNFPYKWEHVYYKGLTYGGRRCDEDYAGPAPLSEPETKAVTQFILQFPNTFKRKWQEREEQLIEESRQLKLELSNASSQKVKTLQSKLATANDMINKLNDNLKNATDEWNKREMKLIEECNHLKHQLQNTPKIIHHDIEHLQEQLKDSQEMNLKLKFDYDSCKDKCTALEHLCADLKKVIMDEQIAEKLYANDNIPATVKQFLSSSSSSVINTLSHVFGCLSKSSSRNRHQRDGSSRKELFTTNESLMINDLSRTYEQNEILKELIKEKEQLKRENMDLNRQIKELEQIVRRRAHPNFSQVSEIIKNDTKQHEQENETIKNLKKELLEKQHIIIDLKNQLIESKAKYDQNLLNLQGKVVNIQEESIKLKEELDKKKSVPVNHGPKCKRRGRTCDPPPPSVRNFRIELSAKEREIQMLNKQLEEMKKTNRKLAKERGYYVAYLSSKEQSADDIHICKKLASEANSEINTPDKPMTDFIKNTTTELQKDDDGMNDHYVKNTESSLKTKSVNFDTNKNVEEKSKTTEIESQDATDYKVLSEKLNFLEEKHQNLQQITCNLLTLFTKDGINEIQTKLTDKEKDASSYEELHRFVTALKDLTN